jgi:hypothetical protein
VQAGSHSGARQREDGRLAAAGVAAAAACGTWGGRQLHLPERQGHTQQLGARLDGCRLLAAAGGKRDGSEAARHLRQPQHGAALGVWRLARQQLQP